MKISKCFLCGQEKELQESHIFPRSYLKYLKDGEPQLWEIPIDQDSVPFLSNLNPTEPLLCFDCEQKISTSYESYGTQIFRKRINIEKNKDYVKIKNFKYTEFYLFLISILWRASISSIDRYKHIRLTDKFNEIIPSCLNKKSLRINPSIKLDHIIRPFIFRVKDFSYQLEDDLIRKLFLDLNLRKAQSPYDAGDYIWFIEGFFVILKVIRPNDIHDLRARKYVNQMQNKTYIKIPFIDIINIPEVANSIITAQKKLKESN